MKVLLIGSDTPAGQALRQYLDLRGTEYTALSKSDCRWKSERQAKKSLRRSECDFTVDLRIQAAADGGIRIHDVDVDRCMWLARASQSLKRPLMLLSCANIFQGLENRAYREEDYPDGESTLAMLLAGAEAAVRDHCERHVILRTGPVFSPLGMNLLTYLLDQLHENGRLSLRRNIRGCPVPVEDAARVVSGMLDQYGCGLESWGIFHYCSPDVASSYEFAEVVLAAASQYNSFNEDDASILTGTDGGENSGEGGGEGGGESGGESGGEGGGEHADGSGAVSAREFRLDCTKIRDTFAIKQQPWRASVAGQVKQYYALNSNKEKADGESHGQRDAGA